jgi:hypothetical protein
MIAPTSAAIWKVASTVPPRLFAPTMSATAAFCGGLSTPEPTPATSDAARNAGTPSVYPSQMVPAPDTARPASTSGLRPMLSASRPDSSSTAALPAANTASETPANPESRRSTSTTKSGISDMRTPNTAQPLAKLDVSAAR